MTASELWADRGTLYAFVADGYRTTTTSTSSRARPIRGNVRPGPEGHREGQGFGRRPRADAGGRLPELPAVPSGGAVGATRRAAVGARPVGQRRQHAERRRGNDVFDFIRLEDIAYDKRPGMSNVVYIADSGRAETGAPAPLTKSTNGRIYKLVLDPTRVGNPTARDDLDPRPGRRRRAPAGSGTTRQRPS